MAKPTNSVQQKAVLHVRDFVIDSERLSSSQKEKLFDVYDGWKSFKEKKSADWSTSFKVNKAHQVVETIVPRLTAKDPRWIVTGKGVDGNPEHAIAVQDYLTYIFEEYKLIEPIRLWAKSMIIYGNAQARVVYKYEMARSVLKTPIKETETIIDDEGNEIESENKIETEEVISGHYPTIENISWTDFKVDPRYTLLEDMPGVSQTLNGARLADLYKDKDAFNLDQVKDLGALQSFQDDQAAFKTRVFQITGIQSTITKSLDLNALSVEKFYGYFNISKGNDPKKERLYEIWVVDDSVCIKFKEILGLPFEAIKAFEDPEQFFATGFVEPILEMMNEMNFKKNSASTYINNSLNRSWLWSPQSGVNPASLVSKPNNIIVASNGVRVAQENLQEIPMSQVPNDYFQEGNDLERQMQSMSFTVDTSNPRNQQALTNTATGARIKFFESNSVINEIRKHFETGLERLAYKLLLSTFENIEDNIVIKKQGTEEFWDINKELLKDAVLKYQIKIESNSSSFDDIDSRREDALAFFNILQQGKAAGIVSDQALKEGLKEVIGTFEKKNVEKFIDAQDIDSFLGKQQQGGQGQPLPQPEQTPTSPEQLTQAVAGGQLQI